MNPTLTGYLGTQESCRAARLSGLLVTSPELKAEWKMQGTNYDTMSATSLVSFGADSNAVTVENAKQHSVTVRLMTKQEFKIAKGLKGNAATNGYNAYIREKGESNPEGLIKGIASGALIVRSIKDFEGSENMHVSLIKRANLRDRLPKGAAAPAKPQTREELLALLAACDAKAQTSGRLDAVSAITV